MGNVSLCASEMQNGLNAQSTAFAYLNIQFWADFLEVGLVGIDEMSSELVGSSSSEKSAHFFEGGGWRELKFMGLYVFVEWHLLCFGWGVVGVEEGEAEVVLVDGYIE